MKLLVLTHPMFNDIELTTVIACLKRSSKVDKITFYNHKYKSASGQFGLCTLELENKVNLDEYDAIFIPGGKGAQELRKDPKSIEVIEYFIKNNKKVCAICDAPNVLFENKLISNQVKYSSFPIESIVSGDGRNEQMVTVDKNIISGRCAASSMEFGLSLVKEFFGNKTYEAVRKGMFGA
ncbi:DJ-1/PfpI family protein [Mycoplasmopsis caviae]|uniref:DJ-1/PfpI family protein n=1 Tax=Mycoplasmopsis caviae TaxID=55603 RepID=A0A3P8MDU0_9BACT|nr:DJ-1/PfpI family protein [Mycoplasmopsis caviae]UUD34931.1 DJ-1/PfpI family protein [Mycoplasmopsis caviae]VDR42240.1 putative intracellular protease/amidase (putative glutaminase) [Mycoplasmopsis caviae]